MDTSQGVGTSHERGPGEAETHHSQPVPPLLLSWPGRRAVRQVIVLKETGSCFLPLAGRCILGVHSQGFEGQALRSSQ